MNRQQPPKRGRPRKTGAIGDAVGRRQRLSRASLHERALERLRALIIGGELTQGAELVEAELCDLIGVSRTPLREALKLLAADRLVELRQNRSARVAVMNGEEITELFETLSGLERHAAELAAARMSADEIARLSAIQEKLNRHFAGNDLGPYFKLNHAMHQAIVAGAHNELLSETHARLIARAEWARYTALESRRRWDESVQEHHGILAALQTRDAPAAGRLLADHVMNTGREVVEALTARERPHADTALCRIP